MLGGVILGSVLTGIFVYATYAVSVFVTHVNIPVTVYAFEHISECKKVQSDLQINCNFLKKKAQVLSRLAQWSFEQPVDCALNYSVEKCVKRTDNSYFVDNTGFAYIPANVNPLAPLYYSKELNKYVLPNGYPVASGRNIAHVFNKNSISDLFTTTSIHEEVCYRTSGGLYSTPKDVCDSIMNHIKDDNSDKIFFGRVKDT